MRYRYPGIQPFSIEDKDIFFGREEDIEDLKKEILIEKIVVLHSKSGMGKSSLIQAGLVSQFKESEHIVPIPIRLGAWQEKNEQSPLEIISLKIPFTDEKTYLDECIAPEQSLWYLFKKFDAQINGLNQTSDPKEIILIFDQFEELFSYPQEAIDTFKQQLSELLYLHVPQRIRDEVNAKFGIDPEAKSEPDQRITTLYHPLNIKVLFSIRSDKLSLMDQLSDAIPSILHHWFELQPLQLINAEDAILEPAYSQLPIFHSQPFDYSNEALDKMLRFLSNNRQNSIESFQLQIICQYAEILAIKHQKKRIEVSDLADMESIFKNYYDRQIARLPNDNDQLAARKFIEEGLIFEQDERRLNLYEGQIFKDYEISPQLLSALVENRLIRPEPDARGGMTYEICHDTLVKPILESKARRIEVEKEESRILESKKNRRRLISLSLVAAGIITVLIIGILQVFMAKQKADTLAKVGELLTLTVESESKDPNLALSLAEKAYQLDPTNANSRRIRGKVFSEHQFYSQIFTHDSPIFAVCLTPDDKFLLTGTKKGEINLWEIASGKLITQFTGYEGEIWNMEITPDGKYIFAEGSSKKIVIWDYHTRSIIRSIDIPTWWVTFNANSQEIIMRTGGDSPAMASYDILSGEVVQDYTALSTGRNMTGAKLMNGRLVFVENTDKQMVIWDAERKNVTQTFNFPVYATAIQDQVISPTGKFLLTGDKSGHIFSWDLNTGRFIQRFSGHKDRISGIRFSQDGNRFVSSGWDQKAYLWETQTGALLSTYNAHKLATSDIMFSNDESFIVTISWDATAKIWPVRKNKAITSWTSQTGKDMVVSLASNYQSLLIGHPDGSIQHMDLDGNLLKRIKGNGIAIQMINQSRDGKLIYTAGADNIIRLWKLETGEEIRQFTQHQQGKIQLAISSDGQTVASGDQSGIIYIWNGSNGEILQTLESHQKAITDLVFSANGKELLVGSQDTRTTLWNVQNGNQIQVFEQKFEANEGGRALIAEISAVAFMVDGQTILTASKDNFLKLWNKQTGAFIQEIDAEESIISVTIDPDGTHIYSGGNDNLVRKWNVQNGKLERTYKLEDEVHFLAFLADKGHLLTGSRDNRLSIFSSIDQYLASGQIVLPPVSSNTP